MNSSHLICYSHWNSTGDPTHDPSDYEPTLDTGGKQSARVGGSPLRLKTRKHYTFPISEAWKSRESLSDVDLKPVIL